MTVSKFTAVTAAALLSASAVAAQPFTSKGAVEGWAIFENAATNGCFMERQDESGTVVQIGGEGGADFGFLAVYAPTSDSETVTDDKIYKILVDIDGEKYLGEGKGAVKEGYAGGYFVSDSPLLIDDLANGKMMMVQVLSGPVVEVPLDGTKKAMEATRACYDALQG